MWGWGFKLFVAVAGFVLIVLFRGNKIRKGTIESNASG
jgi:hypothetical protein